MAQQVQAHQHGPDMSVHGRDQHVDFKDYTFPTILFPAGGTSSSSKAMCTEVCTGGASAHAVDEGLALLRVSMLVVPGGMLSRHPL